MILPLLALLAAPCEAPAPAAVRDAEVAQAYVEAGEEEQGHEGALGAFREALRLDPSNQRAQHGFYAACAGPGDRFEAARALMDQGDRRGAVALLEALRAQGPSPRAALLEGICLYELHEDLRARPLLTEALAKPSVADSARFFLGLVALRAGDDAEAEARLSEVSEASALRAEADQLLRNLRGGRRLSLSALADSGYDSNVTLAPGGEPAGGDAAGTLSGAVLFRPLGESGPFARATGLYHLQLQHHDYDVLAFGGAAGWQLGRFARHLAVEYDFDYLALGGAAYLSAHRLGAGGRYSFGDVAVGGGYGVRFENYQTDVTSSFSGTLHTGDAYLAWGPFEAGYHVGRDLTVQDATSFFEHGPRAALRLAASPRLRLSLAADVLLRGYDAADASFATTANPLGVQRADTLVDGSALAEWDLSGELTLRLVLGGRDALSNVPTLSYVRLYATAGLAWALGLW